MIIVCLYIPCISCSWGITFASSTILQHTYLPFGMFFCLTSSLRFNYLLLFFSFFSLSLFFPLKQHQQHSHGMSPIKCVCVYECCGRMSTNYSQFWNGNANHVCKFMRKFSLKIFGLAISLYLGLALLPFFSILHVYANVCICS